MSEPNTNINTALLMELGQVKGQLASLMTMMQNNHDHMNRRMDDVRHAMETQIKGAVARIDKLEQNERSTAIKAAGAGVASSLIITAAVAAIKGTFGGH